MPTVPMDDDDDFGGIHPSMRPTRADMLIAASIMHAQGRFDEESAVRMPPPEEYAAEVERQRLQLHLFRPKK
jgi:hypothetical protein